MQHPWTPPLAAALCRRYSSLPSLCALSVLPPRRWLFYVGVVAWACGRDDVWTAALRRGLVVDWRAAGGDFVGCGSAGLNDSAAFGQPHAFGHGCWATGGRVPVLYINAIYYTILPVEHGCLPGLYRHLAR